jgi:hypothetical protein
MTVTDIDRDHALRTAAAAGPVAVLAEARDHGLWALLTADLSDAQEAHVQVVSPSELRGGALTSAELAQSTLVVDQLDRPLNFCGAGLQGVVLVPGQSGTSALGTQDRSGVTSALSAHAAGRVVTVERHHSVSLAAHV